MNNLTFTDVAFRQFQGWVKNDPRMTSRILKLINASHRDPYKGIGHPERLKHELNEYWSRHINNEHRLVYKIDNTDLVIISRKYHYF